MDTSTQVELEIDPEHAWRFLTEDDLLGDWLGDGSSIEPEVGGGGVIDDIETGVRRCVEVTDVEPGRRLSFDWWPEPDESAVAEPDISHVSIDIEPTDTGCTITVTEASVDSWRWRLAGAQVQVHVQGMQLQGMQLQAVAA